MMKYNDLRYICPNCFCQRAVNDVLFRRDVVNKTIPDPRKTARWKKIYGISGENICCTQGLADWRIYPESQRLVSDDMVLGIIDYSGDRLTQRICPECHYPTDSIMEYVLRVVPWSTNGFDLNAGEVFLNRIADSLKQEVQYLAPNPETRLMPYKLVTLNNNVRVQLPTGICNNKGIVDSQLSERYFKTSNAVVVFIDFSDADTENDDLALVDSLLDYSETQGFRGSFIDCPTVFIINRTLDNEQSNNSAEEWLQEEHRNLFNAVQGIFLQYKVFFSDIDYAEAASWLSSVSVGVENSL